MKLSGVDTSCFVKPEPQCVTKILGPVKSSYSRAQIVMVEQWWGAPKLGKVIPTNAHKQIANRLSYVRVRWRRRCFGEQAHRLAPDLLSRGGKRQPLLRQRNGATKRLQFGTAEIGYQWSFGVVNPEISVPKRALECIAKALRGRWIKFAQHQIHVHLNGDVGRIWIASGIDTLILVLWGEPSAV